MGNYFLSSSYLDSDIEIFVVENDGGGSDQSIIVYESPGSNGGIVLNAGRLNKQRAISGKILSKLRNTSTVTYTTEDVKQQLSNIISQIDDIKEKGVPVTLKAPITDNSTCTYLIKTFRWQVVTGNGYYVTFTMELEEYRQTNIKSNSINIIGGEVVRALKEREQQIII